jgi:hypothetical protein
MAVMRAMHVAADYVVVMRSVRDPFVSARGVVTVSGLVGIARVPARAGVCRDAGIRGVFVDMSAVTVVQMAVVQIVEVACVTNRSMSAIVAVLMCVIAVRRMLAH